MSWRVPRRVALRELRVFRTAPSLLSRYRAIQARIFALGKRPLDRYRRVSVIAPLAEGALVFGLAWGVVLLPRVEGFDGSIRATFRWRWRPTPEQVEVNAGYLPALHVAGATNAEQAALDRPKARVLETMPEDATDERQQVEVTGRRRRCAPAHPVARDEERPVEAAAVIGDQPGVSRNELGHALQEGRLVGLVGKHQLDATKGCSFPPAEPDQEDKRSDRGAETRRLRVETDQRHVRSRVARQPPEAAPVDGQLLDACLDPDVRAASADNDRTTERPGHSFRPCSRGPSGVDRADRSPQRRRRGMR